MDEKELLENIERAAKENWTKLDLSGKAITSLPPEIGRLTNLTVLDLSGNQLTSVPAELGDLVNVTELRLNSNQLTSVPVELGQLTKLKRLRLDGNQLTSIPEELRNLINLRRLSLANNELATFPSEFGELGNLEVLSLGRNRLTSVPSELFALSNLRVLRLNHNLLTHVPPELSALIKLSELRLENNCLASLPTGLCRLKNLKRLDLGNNGLSSLPVELSELTNLTRLDLGNNQLTVVPKEICHLVAIKRLYLGGNQLVSIPADLGSLINITDLYLHKNRLSEVPEALGRLTNLERLHLHNNQLTDIAVELSLLTRLQELGLSDNRLRRIPKELGQLNNLTHLYLQNNELTSIPEELGQMTELTHLYLQNNRLTTVPVEFGNLSNLEELHLYNNRLTILPRQLGHLVNLQELGLSGNQLTAIPSELGQLSNLQMLFLEYNRLTSIPRELGQLENLAVLRLHNNELTIIPREFGKLNTLSVLRLQNNLLTTVPEDLGKLTNLVALRLLGNPLKSPPAEVVEQGTHAVLEYLRTPKRTQWLSKLLLVGEGGVGKTSLLRAVRGEQFEEGLETTHGIGVEKLLLTHPTESDITMELNTWDFGGQQIYHATHQFFLTNRSLFVLVWDARHGWEAGKLYNWLDRIQAKAPDSPVLIVAAHIDERDADLPLDDLRRKYPQIEGHYTVSNKVGTGIGEFGTKLAQIAAGLPLMGEKWPSSWSDAAEDIRGRREDHVSVKEMFDIMERYDVAGEAAIVLAGWLHELGDILYFKDDDELNETVILNPVWVTEAISDVLESKDVVEKNGVLTRENRNQVWANVDTSVREHFLRLMERFDLSYRTLENREISLVVECLPLDPPDFRKKWETIKGTKECKEISMKFSLNTLPAGIPTWFIARSHRFTTHTHWRIGALFADSEEQRHLGLIEAYPHERHLRLTVRGPAPHNFFALLRDGLELTLTRFPGLKIKRTVPCPGHDGSQCTHEFDFAQLQKAIEREKPVLEVQCQEAFENVSVTGLLFGLHWSAEGKVISRIDELEEKVVGGQQEILTELRELRELAQREFLRLFNAQQSLAESHCPNVFAVLPKGEQNWLDNFLGQKMVLQLFCQAPGQWHPAMEGSKSGRYDMKHPAEFFKSMGPYILKLAKVIKYAAPVIGVVVGAYAGPIGAAMGAEYAKKSAAQIKLMEELAKKLTERDYALAHIEAVFGERDEAKRIEGMELRALRALLDREDPAHEWGGLKKVLTPEGHYLWLCEDHAAEYKK